MSEELTPLRFRPPPPPRRFPVRTGVLLSCAAYLAADLHLLRGPLWKLFFGLTPPRQLPVYDISTSPEAEGTAETSPQK